MPHTQATPAVPGLLGRVLDWLREHTSPGGELGDFSAEELRHMANDLAISENDLIAVATSTHDNTPLMEAMMRARGLDPDAVRNGFAELLRDIQRVCSRCRTSGRCSRELEVGTAAENAHEFCPNAGTFSDLVEYNMGR